MLAISSAITNIFDKPRIVSKLPKFWLQLFRIYNAKQLAPMKSKHGIEVISVKSSKMYTLIVSRSSWLILQ